MCSGFSCDWMFAMSTYFSTEIMRFNAGHT